MMERREVSALALAVLAAIGAALRIAGADEAPAKGVATSFAVTAHVDFVDGDSLGQAAANTVANDPFRLANRPSAVRYDAHTEGVPGAPVPMPPPPVRPQFVVKAIMGGPPWQAVVDGIPNQPPGTIVGAGSVFEKLSVRRVGRDTVVIAGPDTTWKLTLQRGQP